MQLARGQKHDKIVANRNDHAVFAKKEPPGNPKNAKYPRFLFLVQSTERSTCRPFYYYRSLRKRARIGGYSPVKKMRRLR
jgi:hypothetical protein